MKRIIILALLSSSFFLSCRKSDNPKLPDLARVPTPNISLDPASNKFIPPGAPATFQAKIIFDVKFKSDILPKKFDAVVMKNGNTANVKTLQADITAFPTTVSVTGQQLIDLFGAPIADGDLFQIGADVTTQSGQLFQAFPLGGVAFGTGVANEAGGVTTSVQFIKPCTFVPAAYTGNFVVVEDTWQDTSPGDVIEFTAIDATHFSFIYPTAVDPIPIIVAVDPASNTPSITKQDIGTEWVYDNTPPAPTARTLPGAANTVDPCTNTISLSIAWSEGGTEYPRLFRLKKQ